MKFLVDECVGPAIAQWLKHQGYDAISIYDDMCGCSDEIVLQKACTENRILITNDKDFGEMIFRRKMVHCGVILFRLENEQLENKKRILKRILLDHSLVLATNFVVVTDETVRIIQSIDA
ncbi:MAG: DUF5615 family PIN-like protein [bacterium]